MATDSGMAQGKHGLTAIGLLVWLIVGLVLCVRTFRWQRRDAG